MSLIVEKNSHLSAWKNDFPIFDTPQWQTLNYLDSAATYLIPRQVADCLHQYHLEQHANSHRGFYQLSHQATNKVEQARAKVASFINSSSAEQIVFCQNTTHAINLVAQGYLAAKLASVLEPSKANIVVSIAEHHANFLPWQQLCQQTGAELRIAPLNGSQNVDIDKTLELIDQHTLLVAMHHVSNVTGKTADILTVSRAAHGYNAKVLVDGAQAVASHRVDVQALDCDFYVFSGHKLYAGTGVGVLYGTKEALTETQPSILGGGMVEHVSIEQSKWLTSPLKLEAGTHNTGAIIALSSAIDYLQAVRELGAGDYLNRLGKYCFEQLSQLPCIDLVSKQYSQGQTIFSFQLNGVHGHDVASVLDADNIAVRVGHHCCQPLHQYLTLSQTVRVSLAIYNTRQDIEDLVAALANVHQLLSVN